ncbi:hypothetical protein Pcinc_016543 [Petrolisthes cinctipes]|uniref:Uncharacterized protein n=1 Tax=Petrolisthes cinctipes TaxID=88211 RepID=A0AAE1FSP5_PETCI|nr:hypothetical protein Pcinc_016543 [Petrolisthes cinctipes]
MASQDDLGMLWYGVTGVSFNPADPAEVMLNTGTTAPLLSDHPRPLVPTPVSYAEPPATHHTMLYDPTTGDYITQPEYMYESYDGYDDDSSGSQVMQQQQQPGTTPTDGTVQHHPHHHHQPDESPPPLPKSKKPKVHHHPALKLKTPIAYQKDTDLNAIPIMREGMAVCEKCGAIGVKHAFYGKERKFCSLSCARGPLPPPHHHGEVHGETEEETGNSLMPGHKIVGQPAALVSKESCSPSKPSQVVTPTPALAPTPVQDPVPTPAATTVQDPTSTPVTSPTFLPPPESSVDLDGSFSWATTYLDDAAFNAVPVTCFKHAPMSECWEQMSAGMKVEVGCGVEAVAKDAFWVATVIAISGYKAKLRFEGFVEDSSKDFWVDLCSEEVHPVGWCATQGRPLIPPRTIQHKYRDWKEFLMKRLTGARTLPTNFVSRVVESQKSRFRPGLNVEVVDKNRIAQMRVATVTEVVGKRLHLRYHGAPPDDNGFWCHEDAPIIHSVGWSREVGHEIVASQSYHEKCIRGIYDPTDAPPELFTLPPSPAYLRNPKMPFTEGMKLEAIDPLNLSAICVATVMKVLKNNYLMIRIDSYESDNTCSDWFCYHATSPCIFPAGFCEMHNITLTPPRGFEGQFSWFSYLKKTQATAAPPALFNREVPSHGFEEGMALESADLMDPRLVCVATVKQVKGRLLKVHFDGWESDFDQWIDYQSPDIYPVGWCDMSGYRLEGPKSQVFTPLQKRKVKGRAKHRKAGLRGRSMGSRKLGKMASGMSSSAQISAQYPAQAPSPVPGSQVAPGKKPRGRPPKDKSQPFTEFMDTFQAHQKTNEGHTQGVGDEDEGQLCDARLRRSQAKRDARRSPRSGVASAHPSNTKTLPVRATRARTLPALYTHSDDDLSDETSSGVASLDGNESSREPWDVEERSNESVQAISAPPPFDLPPLTPLSHLLTSITTPTSIRSEEEGTGTSEIGGQTRQLTSAESGNHPDIIATDHNTTTNSQHMDTDAIATSTQIPSAPVGSKDTNVSTTEVKSSEANPSSRMAGVDTQGSIEATEETNSSSSGTRVSQTVDGSHTGAHSNSASSSISQSSSTLSPASCAPTLDSNTQSTTTTESELYIPRLIDGPIKDGSKVQPKVWKPKDVAQFLKTNDCGAYCDNFVAQNIDGGRLLRLTQKEVMGLTGMKVGPSLKIHDLVQQLLALVSPAQARYQATLMKRGLSFT